MGYNTDCIHCGIKSQAVETLGIKELEFLNNNCAEVYVKPGEYIIKEGTLSSHIAYLKSGLAKVHMKGPRQLDQILKIVTPGNYIGIQTILVQKVHSYSASALEDSRVCYIDTQSFNELANKNNRFANALIKYLCEEELSYYNRFINQSQKQVNGRLADALLYFSTEIKKSDEFILPLSRYDLAALIGSRRESIARSLKELIEIGVIRAEGKKITILNKELLIKISKKG